MRIERTHDAEDRLDQAVEELREAKRVEAEAADRVRLANEHVIELLHKTRKKSTSIQDGGKYYKATIVSPERVDIDEKGLAKEIGAPAFRKVSDLKVNRKKLEEALASGELSAEVVGKHLHTRDARPYIRFTEGVLDDADGPASAGD